MVLSSAAKDDATRRMADRRVNHHCHHCPRCCLSHCPHCYRRPRCKWCRRPHPVITHIVLVLLPLLRWHWHCPHYHIVRVVAHVALASSSKLAPILHRHCCPCCSGIITVVALALSSSAGCPRCAGHPHCAGVVFVHGIVYHVICIIAHKALALLPTLQWCRCPCCIVAHIALSTALLT